MSSVLNIKTDQRPHLLFSLLKMQWPMCIINVCNVTKNRPMKQNTLMLAVLFFLFINVFFLTFKRKNNLFLAIDRG